MIIAMHASNGTMMAMLDKGNSGFPIATDVMQLKMKVRLYGQDGS